MVVDSRYAAAHSPRNFRDPESFVPERWLDDPAYKNDDRAAAQPFSLGPRNCIGKKYVTTNIWYVVQDALTSYQSCICRDAPDPDACDLELQSRRYHGYLYMAETQQDILSLGETTSAGTAYSSGSAMN